MRASLKPLAAAAAVLSALLALGLWLLAPRASHPALPVPDPFRDAPAAGPAPPLPAGPEIVGSPRFSNQVRQALQLLRARDTNAYAIVAQYVGRIQQGERSGMWAYRNPPTFEMADPTAFYSVTWCAAAIAHDAFHSKLYHDHLRLHGGHVPDSVWTGIEAEKRCMKHQILVMEHIGANTLELDHARSQQDGRYTKDNETWQEYLDKRKW